MRRTAPVVAALALSLPLASLTVTGLPASAAAVPKGGSPGAASIGDPLFPTIGNGGYDVRHYDISLDYRSNTSIRATTTIAARATKRLSRFSLDLEGLHVDAVTVDGHTARYRRAGTKLIITPSHPLVGSFTTKVRYHGAPVTHTDPDGSPDGWIRTTDGATVQSEPVGAATWFPNNNTPQDKAGFRVSVTAPSALAVAGNGTLVKHRHGARTTWTWTQPKPMATYLAMISVGRYQVTHTSVRLRSGKRIPVWNFVDPIFGSAKSERDLVGPIIRFEEGFYGPYPWNSAGVVIDNSKSGYALENASRPVFDGLPDVLTEVHEYGHQWYGDSVTPKRWMDVWLNEGFADYTEKLWTAKHGGPSVRAQYQTIYEDTPAGARLWSPAPARFSDPADLFGDPVYTRGGMTLAALRLEIGDTAFFSLLRRWAADHRYGSGTTAEFIALAERVSHRQLDGFFTTWLYTAKKPARF